MAGLPALAAHVLVVLRMLVLAGAEFRFAAAHAVLSGLARPVLLSAAAPIVALLLHLSSVLPALLMRSLLLLVLRAARTLSARLIIPVVASCHLVLLVEGAAARSAGAVVRTFVQVACRQGKRGRAGVARR
jgi:hypothetical protein